MHALAGVGIDAFSRHNGGTLLKLGSHRLNVGPPREWNAVPSGEALPGGRSSAGGGAVGKAMTPYAGPDCHTVECPAGSVILYDARTWHRMGENRSDGPRSCIPLATIPAFVMPFFDKSPVYIRFVTSRLYEELSERERDDLERMFVTKVAGEGVSADPELKDIKETGLRDNPKL